MDDLISRQAAIDIFDDYNASVENGEFEAYGRDRKRLCNLPSVQSKQKWIPCSERLPKEYGEYRITWATSASEKRFIGDSEYEITGEWDNEHNRFKGEWLLADYIKDYPDVKVIAWKPIEEPYREGEQNDECNQMRMGRKAGRMSTIKCGWLSSSGEFVQCEPYEHMAVAQGLIASKALYSVADDYLLDHGWVKIYRESFNGHKWHVDWKGFLSDPQKSFLRPIFEDCENDIYAYCRYCWEIECEWAEGRG